jgi:very-short-patch-repair endonuclease
MSAGIDRLIRDLQDELEARIRFRYDRLAGTATDSPIERLFRIAFEMGLGPCMPNLGQLVETPEAPEDADLGGWDIGLWCQHRVLDWPVDFLVGTTDGNGKKRFAVIECDGHDFHERTKEQAKRDRSRDRRLQAAGYRVFRFTGSELYRNTLACACEVINWAHDVMLGGDA